MLNEPMLSYANINAGQFCGVLCHAEKTGTFEMLPY